MPLNAPQSPPPPPPPDPIGPSSGSGCGWKIPGCVLGCAAAIAVVVLAVVAVAWWFLGPGTQHPTGAAVGTESTGALQVRDLGADAGARQALEAVVAEARRRAPAREQADRNLPSWFPASDSGAMASAIAKILPREGTLSFERVAGRDEPAAVLVLNLRGFTRPLRMMLAGDKGSVERYRGVTVASEEGGDALFAMVDGTLVMADDRDALHATLDRLLDGTGEPLEHRMEILKQPASGALLSGGLGFEPGELAAMARSEAEEKGTPPPADPAALEGVRRLELMVDSVDPRTVRFRVGVGADSSTAADRAAATLADTLRTELAPATAAVSHRATSAGAVLDVQLTDWIEPFTEWLVANGAGDASSPGSSGDPGSS